MKTIKKLKLNKLSQTYLGKNEQNRLMGGTGCCTCGCAYANSGGSSTSDNAQANKAGGLHSSGGGVANTYM